MLRLLLKNKLNIMFLGFTRDETKSRVGRIIGTSIGVIVFCTILYFSNRLISFMYNQLDGEIVNLILDLSLDYVFAAILVVVILTGIATSFYILYLSRDLELLLSLPIKYRTVFIYKFIEILISNSFLFIMLVLPFLIAYGISSAIPLVYYPVSFLIFLAIMSLPTSIGVLIGMLGARYVNPARAKELFGLAGGLIAIAFFIFFQVLPRAIESRIPELKSMEIGAIKKLIVAIFDKPFLKILPTTQGSNALSSFHIGDYGSFGLSFVLILLISAALVFVCIILSQRLYYSGWSSSNRVVLRKRNSGEEAGSRAAAGSRISKIPIFAGVNYLLIKDLKILFRTPIRLMQIFIPFIIYIFIFWTMLNDGGDRNLNIAIELDTMLFLFFPLLTIGIVNMNVSGSNIGGEELNYWILMVSPLTTKKLLQIKIVYSSVISIACGMVGIIALSIMMRPSPVYILLGLLLLVLFSWGESVIGTSIGAIFPEFKPIQSSKSNITFLGGLLIFLSFIIYLLIFAGIVVGVLYAGSALFSWPILVTSLVIVALELIVVLILYNVLVNTSTYRLNRLEWKY
jgi:ABC-2 type transport system permease protein